jgi:anti-sigma factor RsiW
MNHITDNHDALLDYLYEEGDPAQRLTIAKHLQECAACTVAVLEFQNVRGMLSDWTPPASPSLSAPVNHGARSGRWRGWGSATTKESPRALSPSIRKGFLQAAAAILLFVSGMAVSQLHVDYRDGALTVHLRPVAADAPVASSRGTWITLHPERLRPEPDSPAPSDGSENERERLLQRVRAMIDQSEQRQQRELALRLSQVSREVDTQHRADLLRIQQDFGQQQEATLDYLVKTSGGVK